MSFRRTLNAHDRWLRYCESQDAAVRATGLPLEFFRRADDLEAFLEHGSSHASNGAEILLANITDAAFLALEKIVNNYFDFQEGYPVFQRERFRRFQRYG